MNAAARHLILFGTIFSLFQFTIAQQSRYHDRDGLLSRILEEDGFYRTDLEIKLLGAAKTLEVESIHPVNEGDNEFNKRMRGALRRRGCKTKKSKSKSKKSSSHESGKGKGKGKSRKSFCSDTDAPSSSPSLTRSLRPSIVTSESPSSSSIPSDAPSIVPTDYPSSVPSELGFVLSDCSSYSFLWLRNLSETCKIDPEDDSSYIECECKDAQERLDSGEIKDCGYYHRCPRNCAVCELCLSSLVTCPP